MEDIVDIKQFRVIFKTICLGYLLLYRVLSLNYFHCPNGTILIANDQTVRSVVSRPKQHAKLVFSQK